jgi:esterase/lipase superfamily enzyme
LAEDPLVARDSVTLDDIRQGLASPRRKGTVIDRHFKRVTAASQAEKREFLALALKDEALEVQRQAARELDALGMLESVVSELLLEFVQSEDPELRQVAVIALEHVDYKKEDLPEAYWDALIEGLASNDPEIVLSISDRLQELGPSALPSLIKALRSPTPLIQHEAAKVLSKIIGGKAAHEVKPGESSTPATLERVPATKPTPNPIPNVVPMAKGPTATETPLSARQVDADKPNTVRVYFGTNRELIQPEQPPWSRILFYPALSLSLLVSLLMVWWRPREDKSYGCVSVLLTSLFLIGILWTLSVFRSELLDRWRIGIGPRFGPRRDSTEQVHYGTCDVSIPPKHQSGVIETPVLGPEDENLHVVLKKTEEMEEKAFFQAVQAKVAELPKEQRSCFVFIHGFNVTFENAAKRTAQIHYDLEFSGIPIFFSWPSRASLRHYFSDRNEIEFSRYVIKQFLLDVSQRVNADRIHVIAHSMGADATCRAIAELGERGKIFDQIILAAPDIDREVFRLQLAPRMTLAANRTTMYCSKNDMALIASNTFNDGPRAGDSSKGVLVTKELDTVDASGIDTALLGHSYYGDCLPILNDVRKLVSLDLPPKERNLLAWPVENELSYWTLIEQLVKAEDNTENEKGR